MKTDDLEDELRSLKFAHLAEGELVAYCEQELDKISRARAEAHVKQCFICERRLELLREEKAALSQRVTTDEDVAFVARLLRQTGSEHKPSITSTEAARGVPLREILDEYLRRMVASLQVAFKPVRGAEQGEEIWSWRSGDGRLQARATMEKNADMIIHFSTTEMELEGARLHFRLGALNLETTLRRVSESQVAAQVDVPWQYRQLSTADMSIEIL